MIRIPNPWSKSGGEYLQDLKEETSQFFAFIGVILGAFAALALLVSSFVISNTFAVLVGQRIRELALLRTLGAHGKSLVRMLLVEALVVGGYFLRYRRCARLPGRSARRCVV